VQRAFGQRFAGPKAPLSTYEACVFGKTKPGDHHVVQVTVFTKATLQTLGTTARAYLHGNRQPTATTVSGLGAEAFVQGADVWVRTGSDDVLDVGADFAAGRSALEALARDALRRL
jgi:hypothetical protein